MSEDRLKLFYTRHHNDVVQCCVVLDDEFFVKDITPLQALQLASDILKHALMAEERHDRFHL